MQMRLPRLGEGAESGTVVNILVKEGDTVEKDDVVLELENEKAVAPIPATASGQVRKIHVKIGDSVSVGQPILTLGGDGVEEPEEEAPAGEPAQAAPAQAAPPAAAMPAQAPVAAPGAYQFQSPSGAPPPAPPALRKIAREIGLDLSRVPGTGGGGRITHEDVRRYIQQLQIFALQAQAPQAYAGPSKPAPKPVDFEKFGPVVRQSASSLRKKIAEQMVLSWTTVPHVTQFDEADLSRVMELRAKHKAAYEKHGVSLTVTVFVLKALVSVLERHPIFNASLDDASQEIVFKRYFHIGIAVDTENGLIVPVIRDVDKKTMLELGRDLQTLAEKTRQRKVSMDELQGGSFTVSNQGSIGGGHFTPIVNHPEAAILGLGRGVQRPVYEGSKWVARPILPVSLSYDHRLIDGGSAARFTTDLVEALRSFDEDEVRLAGSRPEPASAAKGKPAAAKKSAAKKGKR